MPTESGDPHHAQTAGLVSDISGFASKVEEETLNAHSNSHRGFSPVLRAVPTTGSRLNGFQNGRWGPQSPR
jgi:hypothetical protein